jgi:hypothetical protein
MPNCILRLAAALLALWAAACTLPTVPSDPSPVDQLEIRGTTLMMVGGQGRLTAWHLTDGGEREVAATWTADGDVVSITSSGAVTARRLGAATVHARYQGRTGVGTVHVVTSVAGTWRGSVTVMDCWQSPVTSPDPCANRRGVTAPLVLTVSQSAAAELGNLTGTIEVYAPPARGNFVGLLDSGGTFLVQGHVERAQDGLQGGVTFRWQLEGEQLVPLTINGTPDDTIDVALAMRAGGGFVTFAEIWKMSELTR